ncbi:MAG TPA: AAA family ATPase [Verrucomicrobiae bacterium]|nr:AAA family ATPase [Verrucomicrobiae bacterium]
MSETKSKSLERTADVAALLRARNPLLWIVSREEARVEAALFEAAASAGYVARTWDVGQGVADMGGRVQPNLASPDPGDMLRVIGERAQRGGERGVWILRDLAPWLSGSIGLTTCRQLRNLARILPTIARDNAQAVIVLSTSADVPPELANHATVIEWPMPDREEIAAILDAAINALPDTMKETAAPNGTRDAAIDAAIGLSGEEAAACYARSLVQHRAIVPATVAKEKKRVIARERVLEWYDPLLGGLDAVGGLDVLKGWLASRRQAYSAKARAYGLPAPRGAMLVGIPGCGKSLTAKAIATAWGVPLLRLDLGSLKSKFVGESEGNLRRALRVVEAIGRCVVWLDEIEKALAGATQGAADGGVSSDALGTILSWMQERAGEAFVIATANDVTSLPPELMRKGRFDEIWFVDLPTYQERADIAIAALKANGRGDNRTIDLPAIANATAGFTGSEIAALVPDAMYTAFADGGRDIITSDMLMAAATVVPLSKTSAEKIATLRSWAEGRARRATTAEAAIAGGTIAARSIDL